MKDIVLGQGAYGAVTARDGFAYKKFAKADHLIQEYAAGSYLRNSKNIVKVYEANHKTLELKMEQYAMNLRKYMENTLDDKVKRKLLHDMLSGLCEIHKRGMVHGDIKPGNILIGLDSKSNPTAYIGDLGFVSLAPYSKVRRTTAVYRDEAMRQHSSHDMYSMGVVMLELFGELKVYEKLEHKEAVASCEKNIKNKTLRKIIIRLTDGDHHKRPSAEQVLKELYNEEFATPFENTPDYKHGLPKKLVDKVDAWMRPLCKDYEVKRGMRGFKGLLLFIYKNSEATKGHFKLHTGVMVMILSSLFGRSKFQEKELMKWCRKKYSHEEVLQASAALLANYDVIRLLLLQ